MITDGSGTGQTVHLLSRYTVMDKMEYVGVLGEREVVYCGTVGEQGNWSRRFGNRLADVCEGFAK